MANKTPRTTGKVPAATDDELMLQDPDAVLAVLERVIIRSARAFARPLAPAIKSISIALRELQDDAPTVDQEVGVYVYMPFNADNNDASYRRVEAEFYNLQPEEMKNFVRLVDDVRAERGDDEGLGTEAEQDRANHSNQKGKAAKLEELRKTARAQDLALTEAQTQIAELKRMVNQRDGEREDDEKTTSRMEELQELLHVANVEVFKEKARNAELKEELMMYRRDPKKRPLASLKIRGDADDDLAEETGEKGADDAENNAPTSNHADDRASSIGGAKAPKKGAPDAPSKKPRPSMPSYTPMPKPTRSNSLATDQPGTSKKPPRTGRKQEGKDTYRNGYEIDDGPAWGINDDVPEKPGKTRRQSRQINAQSTSDQQTPEGAPAGTSAAHESHGTPSGQATSGGPGRKQPKASTRVRKSKSEQGSESDVDSDEDFEKLVEHISKKKKRKSESSDREEQPKASKKPRIASKLQLVEEESDDEDKHVRAVKGSRMSSVSKAKLSLSEQNAKRKAARDDSAESEGGMSDPVFILSDKETDSDTDDGD